MPTNLGPRWPPNIARKPPRLSPEDLEIWTRWYPTVAAGVEALYFDVGLGTGEQIPEGTPANLARMWLRNTQKRADAILIRADVVQLAELRFDATLNAVGRLLGYELLFLDDDPFQLPLELHLVTNRADPDLPRVCEHYGIGLTII